MGTNEEMSIELTEYTPVREPQKKTQRALSKVSGAVISHSKCEDLSHYNLGIKSKRDLILRDLTGY